MGQLQSTKSRIAVQQHIAAQNQRDNAEKIYLCPTCIEVAKDEFIKTKQFQEEKKTSPKKRLERVGQAMFTDKRYHSGSAGTILGIHESCVHYTAAKKALKESISDSSKVKSVIMMCEP